jgi:hypothetical protein
MEVEIYQNMQNTSLRLNLALVALDLPGKQAERHFLSILFQLGG